MRKTRKIMEEMTPVEVRMDSSILEATVDVRLWQDQAEVGGVKYSLSELTDLLSRGMPAADLQSVHRVKSEFEGQVVLAKETIDLEPISR
jgi:hypothetical protein